MKTFSIANQKGGVGKTTTATLLADQLTQKGYRVLFIDLDAQGNASYTLNADRQGKTIRDVLLRQTTIKEVTQECWSISVAPASNMLAGLDNVLVETGKEYRLKEALEPIQNDYDFCIIDTPPAINIATLNALTASDSVIIVAQADVFSIEAIGQLYLTISSIRRYTNPNLKIDGILINRFSERAVISKELSEMINDTATKLQTKVYSAPIREAIAVRESQAFQRSLFRHYTPSKVVKDFESFIDEFIKNNA